MLYLLGYAGQGQLRIFGKSNEKLHVRGGNDQIVARLGDRLQRPDHARLRARRRSGCAADGTLHAEPAPGLAHAQRDAPITSCWRCRSRSCAAPSTTRKAGFSQVKRTAIEQLGMGTNSKLTLQFRDRHWRLLGQNGNSYSDTGYHRRGGLARTARHERACSSTTPAGTSAPGSEAAR